MWASITILVLLAMELGMNLAKHGESKSKEKYNFWTNLLTVAFELWLFAKAGLFDSLMK